MQNNADIGLSGLSNAIAVQQVQQSLSVIKEMFEDRGYDVSSFDDVDVTNLTDVIFYIDVPSCTMRIVYHLSPKFKWQEVKKLVDDRPETYDAIIVARDKQKNIESGFPVFWILELQYNITKHSFVPKHTIVSDTEKADVLSKYKVKLKELPVILSTDPVARYLGLKQGQLVRIERPSPSSGTYVTYRCCR